MKSSREIVNWLIENCVDEEGDICLNYLDFGNFKGDIHVNHWKVRGSLCQSFQEVEGDLLQRNQKVKGYKLQD